MSRPTMIIDSRPWWLPQRWLVAACATVGAVAAVTWWAADPAAADHAPVFRSERAAWGPAVSPFAPVSADSMAPSPQTPAPAIGVVPVVVPQPVPAAPQPAPLSTMVGPGVHVTPLSVPPGTVPLPAGPSPNDSEAEN